MSHQPQTPVELLLLGKVSGQPPAGRLPGIAVREKKPSSRRRAFCALPMVIE